MRIGNAIGLSKIGYYPTGSLNVNRMASPEAMNSLKKLDSGTPVAESGVRPPERLNLSSAGYGRVNNTLYNDLGTKLDIYA